MANSIQTGLRIPSELDNKITAKAKELGISKNAFLLVLIDLGFKAYDSLSPSQPEQSHEQLRTLQCASE
jgi:hypothetical protein